MSDTSLSIDLRNVSRQYGETFAVKDLNLQIKRGEFFSFLGPSGCGKTTTLRMIGGFEQPTAGQILLEGSPIEGTPPYKRNINTVFQSYALFPHMSIADNVAFGLKMKGVAASEIGARVATALETVKLKDYGKRMPGQLSGGQRQRVALARAIVNQPAVLLLDEPLGALDLKLRRAMQIELKELQARLGITFVFVTHDQEEALTISDRIAVMSQGRLEQVGDPTEIYERPASRFVADFIGTTNFLEGSISEVRGEQVTLKTASGAIRACGRSDLKPGTDVAISIRPEKIVVGAQRPDGSERSELDNVMEGTVHEVIYLGTATHLIVALDAGRQLTVFSQNGQHAQAAPRHGERICVGFRSEHCRILER